MDAKINALIVDDSGIMRKLVMRCLKETRLAEFNFTEASDGVDALAKFDPDRTRIIFVDWNMPNMSGLDFVLKLREQQKRRVPVVMITTERTMGKVEEAMSSAGVDAYVCKPFTADVLRQKIEPVIARVTEPLRSGFFSKLAEKLS